MWRRSSRFVQISLDAWKKSSQTCGFIVGAIFFSNANYLKDKIRKVVVRTCGENSWRDVEPSKSDYCIRIFFFFYGFDQFLICDYKPREKINAKTPKRPHDGKPKPNTAAKRLRMRQVEHFRSLFQSHFPVKVSRALHSVCGLWFSCSALCYSCFWLFCSYWNCFYG